MLFCHSDFLSGETRKSTQADRERLEETFQSFGFDVSAYDDLTFKEISTILTKLLYADRAVHDSMDCLVVAVVTKGTEDTLFAKDEQYPPQNLWKQFSGYNCPGLAGKPKLFFIEVNFKISQIFCLQINA